MSDKSRARPSETGSREPSPSSTGLGPSGFDPARWRTDELPFDNRPMRQFIVVDGWKEHSGHLWHRRYADLAYIRRDDQPDNVLGYRAEDMERIMRDGDMDGVERVVGWLACDVRYAPVGPAAIATEARRAETENTGSVHEGADPKGIAQEPTP